MENEGALPQGLVMAFAIEGRYPIFITAWEHVRFFFLITSSTPFSGQQDGLQRENAEYGDMLIAPSTFVFVDDGNFISFGHMNATIWCMKEIMSKIDDFWYLYVASDDVYLEAASLVGNSGPSLAEA